MTVGIYTFELHLDATRSLKAKRQILRRLKDRLRSRHNVAVSEISDHADLWQRAGLAVVSIAHNRDALTHLFEAVHREAERQIPGQVIETGREFLEAADAGPGTWSEDWE